jgi:lactoylglutathione lyase
MTMFSDTMLNLYSPDVARATAFYRDLLGFAQTFQYPASGPAQHVELRIGSSTIAISGYDAVAETGLPAPSRGNGHELVVECDDVDAAVDDLRAAGTPVLLEPHDHVAGHRRAYVSDPDGNWIALVASS